MSTVPPDESPYIGPRPFEARDARFFFGRDTEVEDILGLILSHQVVLLYAASGAGKTSLLNVAVVRRLEHDERFDVLPVVRVRGLSDTVLDEENVFVASVLSRLSADGSASGSLQGYLRDLPRTTTDDLPAPRALLIDQFEEIFSAYPDRWDDRSAFFRDLAVALRDDPLLRVVLSLREDFLAQLGPYAKLLPDGFRARYRLERLGPTPALHALREPARAAGCPFAEGVAEQLVDDLRKVRLETEQGVREIADEFVEPVQLQVTAHTMWQALPDGATEISEQHRQRFGDVDDVLRDFYDGAIASAATTGRIREDVLRARFASTFLTPMGTRGTVISTPGGAGGIPARAIEELDARHVIRAEHRAGARWYELTHDRLIEPIRTSNRTRERRRRERRQRRALVGVGVVLAALIATAVTALAHGSKSSDEPGPSARGPVVVTVFLRPVLPLTRGPARVGSINSISFARGGHAVLVVGDLGGRMLAADDLQSLKELPPIIKSDESQRLAAVERVGIRLQAFLSPGTVRGGRVTLANGTSLGDYSAERPVSIALDRRAHRAAVLDRSGRLTIYYTRVKRRPLVYPPRQDYATPSLGGDRVFFVASNRIQRGSTARKRLDTPPKLASVHAAGIAVTGDGRLIAAYGDSPQVRLFDGRGTRVGQLPIGDVVAADFSPSGDRLAIGHGDGTVDIWRTRPELVLETPLVTRGRSMSTITAEVHNAGALSSVTATVRVGARARFVRPLAAGQWARLKFVIPNLPSGIPALVRITPSYAGPPTGVHAAEWLNGRYKEVTAVAARYGWPSADASAQIVAAALTAASRGREIQDEPVRQLQAFAGVLHDVKLPDVPKTANSVMFATWCYFQARVTDPNGVDYRTAYLSTTYDSTGLEHQGEHQRSTPQPGDLVFYHGEAPVAIYVGGGKVVRWTKLADGGSSLHPAVVSIGSPAERYDIRTYSTHRVSSQH
jgi:hypothetical protein